MLLACAPAFSCPTTIHDLMAPLHRKPGKGAVAFRRQENGPLGVLRPPGCSALLKVFFFRGTVLRTRQRCYSFAACPGASLRSRQDSSQAGVASLSGSQRPTARPYVYSGRASRKAPSLPSADGLSAVYGLPTGHAAGSFTQPAANRLCADSTVKVCIDGSSGSAAHRLMNARGDEGVHSMWHARER